MSIAPPPDGRSDNQNQPPRTASEKTPVLGDAWSLRVATVAGIPIRLHFTFLLFLLWIGLAGQSIGLSVVYVVAIFACIVLHELGHSVVAQKYDIPVSSITLYPIGGVASIEKRPKPKQEFWIALAGPAVNVVIALILWVALALPSGAQIVHDLTQQAAGGRVLAERVMMTNVLLVAFNLIPAFPMDGGRVLRAVLAMNMRPAQATQIAATIGQVIAVAAGLFALFSHQWWYLFIAFFVYTGAGQEAGAYRQAALMEGVHVREAMITDVRHLRPGDTLKEAAAVLLDTSQHDFPVLLGETVQGVLTRNDLLRGLSEQGPSTYVASAMNRTYAAAGPDDDLAETLPRLQGSPGPLLVMDGERLLGIITSDNIQEFFAIRQIALARSRG